jgi:hypothetical protein
MKTSRSREHGMASSRLFTSRLLGLLSVSFLTGSVAYADDTKASKPAPDESQLTEHGSYINKDGQQVHAPAHSKNGSIPTGATAKCADGSYSFSRHHRGTCSHHGGVVTWLN